MPPSAWSRHEGLPSGIPRSAAACPPFAASRVCSDTRRTPDRRRRHHRPYVRKLRLTWAVDLSESIHLRDKTWYEFTSPPTVVGDVVVLGSSVGDNQAVEMASGAVRAVDA